MPCCVCLLPPPTTLKHRTVFWWPNFTFSHSSPTIAQHGDRDYEHHWYRPRTLPRRRHSLPNGTEVAEHPAVAHLPAAKRTQKKARKTLKSAKTVAGPLVEASMSDRDQPPSGPPPIHHGASTQHDNSSGQGWSSRLAPNNPFRSHAHASGQPDRHLSSSSQQPPPPYESPPAPSPDWSGDRTQAHRMDEQYAPPPGPPPSHAREACAPPPGPPPAKQGETEPEPPPYDPWMQVPDNSLLHPPPSFKQERSPVANATYDDAKRAHAWCRSNPLWQPRKHDQQTLSRIANGDIRLTAPPGARDVVHHDPTRGRSRVKTDTHGKDTIFLSDIPLYTAQHNLHTATKQRITIYYELEVLAMGTGQGDAGIALGFLAPPYPSWRLPGWHRASLGVHGDDGRRYVDDSYGGKDFVQPFGRNDVVGVGMMFSPASAGGKVEAFFTRNGKREGGWDLHEERDRDQEEGEPEGLEGRHDLLAAVGCFGRVELEIRFRRGDWMFKP